VAATENRKLRHGEISAALAKPASIWSVERSRILFLQLFRGAPMGWREIVAANIVKLTLMATLLLYIAYAWGNRRYRSILRLFALIITFVCGVMLMVSLDVMPGWLAPYAEPTLLRKELALPASYLLLIVLAWWSYAIAVKWVSHEQHSASGSIDRKIKEEKLSFFERMLHKKDAAP
jgi:hypothetical protein